MFKTISIVASVLSSLLLAAVVWSMIPALQKQVNDQAEAIEQTKIYEHVINFQKNITSGSSTGYADLYFSFYDEIETLSETRFFSILSEGRIIFRTGYNPETSSLSNFLYQFQFLCYNNATEKYSAFAGGQFFDIILNENTFIIK